MPEIDPDVIDEVLDRTQTVGIGELITLIERAHPETSGLSRETLASYTYALGDAPSDPFDREALRAAIDDRLIETDTWATDKAFYAFDDRISVYPPRWHEELGGTTDIPAYIRFIEDEVTGGETAITSASPGDGIPEGDLLDIVSIVGRTDKETAKARLEHHRDTGDLTEAPDQHPDARVSLRERTDRRDSMLEP
jgi:hypothetical protein